MFDKEIAYTTLIVYFIFCIGIVMIFSTTSADLLDHAVDSNFYLPILKQVSYGLIGVILAFVISRGNIRFWIQYSPYFYWILVALLVFVLIPGLGREVNGAKRWLIIGGVSLQPSEFFKYLIPLMLANRYAARNYSIQSFKEFVSLLAPLSLPIFLILLQPNNGTVALILCEIIMLLFIMNVPKKYWAMPILILCILGVGAASTLPYVSGRIDVFMHPEKDLLGRGHQPYQAKIAAGSGGIFGKGPGNGWQKLSYLPEAQNDYIAAIYGEEFGFLGILLLVFLYMMLVGALAQIAMRMENKQSLYICSGVMVITCLQAFLNLAVVSGLTPSTGLNLPFFSQGGSSLMANLAGIGLVLSAIKSDAVKKAY